MHTHVLTQLQSGQFWRVSQVYAMLPRERERKREEQECRVERVIGLLLSTTS